MDLVLRCSKYQLEIKLDLDLLGDRITLLQYVIKFVGVISSLAKLIPPNAPRLGEKLKTPRQYLGRYSKSHFLSKHVTKVVANFRFHNQFDYEALQELYTLVIEGKVTSPIKCVVRKTEVEGQVLYKYINPTFYDGEYGNKLFKNGRVTRFL